MNPFKVLNMGPVREECSQELLEHVLGQIVMGLRHNPHIQK